MIAVGTSTWLTTKILSLALITIASKSSQQGKVLEDVWGRSGGWGRKKLEGPTGIAINSSDKVYVSEKNTHRVSVFTSEGQFVTSFGSEGVGPGKFDGPILDWQWIVVE